MAKGSQLRISRADQRRARTDLPDARRIQPGVRGRRRRGWRELLQRQHADGKLSEPEFQQKKEDLRAWGANPAAENDPAVHRGRLEQRRAAGAVTDAEYAQRSAELDAWEKGLAQVRSGA
ncbi:MAG: hypothetical protein E6G41_15100 [Actinobacteria bacterium]|nr:MAG: hypothetical protein E6G41_15100 [Actinomycetota bacterium]